MSGPPWDKQLGVGPGIHDGVGDAAVSPQNKSAQKSSGIL